MASVVMGNVISQASVASTAIRTVSVSVGRMLLEFGVVLDCAVVGGQTSIVSTTIVRKGPYG